jgi:hypothetical protein
MAESSAEVGTTLIDYAIMTARLGFGARQDVAKR